MSDRLDGKAAIVTGAASGIGEASAIMYAREGASVMCVDLNGDGAAATAQVITDGGGRAISAAADLSVPEQAEAMTQATLDAFGKIDVVYACAGIAGGGTAADTSMETWDRVIGVNLTSKWLSFKYALPSMVEQGKGSVIVQASIGGIIGVPGIFPYAAAKGGCLGMMKQTAMEYGPSNVRVNAIAPGQVPTPLVVESYKQGGGMTASMGVEEGMRRAGELYPLRRTGTVEEVAALATYLASDESGWTTGQTFIIDGGIDEPIVGHTNLEFGRAFYAAFTGGDAEGLRELIAPDAVWHVGGNNAMTGTYVGHEAIFGLFARIGEMSGGTFSLEVHDLLASDAHVVALNRVRGEKDGVTTDERIIHVIHTDGSRLTEFWGFPENTAGFDEFWT